jgi:hypothetical protein
MRAAVRSDEDENTTTLRGESAKLVVVDWKIKLRLQTVNEKEGSWQIIVMIRNECRQ